jgi:hypothetical protein
VHAQTGDDFEMVCPKNLFAKDHLWSFLINDRRKLSEIFINKKVAATLIALRINVSTFRNLKLLYRFI